MMNAQIMDAIQGEMVRGTVAEFIAAAKVVAQRAGYCLMFTMGSSGEFQLIAGDSYARSAQTAAEMPKPGPDLPPPISAGDVPTAALAAKICKTCGKVARLRLRATGDCYACYAAAKKKVR